MSSSLPVTLLVSLKDAKELLPVESESSISTLMVGFLTLAPLSGANGGGGGPVLDVTQLSLLSELSLRIFPSYNKHNISNSNI